MEFEFVKNLVHKLLKETGSPDVFEIARKNGVLIRYENWYPITMGEFEKKSKTIRVNLRVLANKEAAQGLEKTIIAHELGHYFLSEFKFNKKEEEILAHEFAGYLISLAENHYC